MKFVAGKYKTYDGAAKRLAFERAMNPGEFARGDVGRLYSYSIVEVDGFYRVAKERKSTGVMPVKKNPISRESEPAFQLEAMIDRHSLAKVLDMLSGVCGQKASHIVDNWQDYTLANRWQRASDKLHNLSAAFRKSRL